MIKKFFKVFLISLAVVFFAALAGYIYMAYHYGASFSYGTVVNGINCTGKTIEEINDELISDLINYEGLTILDKDGESYTLSASDVNLTYDYLTPLYDLYFSQNSLLWGLNLLPSYQDKLIKPQIFYNHEKLDILVDKLPIWEKDVPDDKRQVKMVEGTEGIYLLNQRENVFRPEKARELIYLYFDNSEPILDLREQGCYENLSLNDNMMKTISDYQKIKEFEDCGITYKFGDDVIEITPKDADGFILRDEKGDIVYEEDGSLSIDELKVFEFVDNLLANYNTVGKDRLFKTTQGRTVVVHGGNYGNKIDVEAEKIYLLNALKNKERGVREPEFVQKAWAIGENDIGDTYIEVDMDTQHLYYYVDGKIKVHSDIVTGSIAAGHKTPEGTYFIYNKARNATLRGPDYVSFVNYWLGVHKGIGIHDASWRHGKFGGEIYKTNGSHGCINTQKQEISEIYEMVEIGTPVVCFY